MLEPLSEHRELKYRWGERGWIILTYNFTPMRQIVNGWFWNVHLTTATGHYHASNQEPLDSYIEALNEAVQFCKEKEG